MDHVVEKDSGGSILDERSYVYDSASNLKKQVINGTDTSYGYDLANELCWEYTGKSTNACGSPPSGATTYSHDLNGNMTGSSAGLALSYNVRDHTTSYTPVGGAAISFAYAGADETERTAVGGTAQHNTALGLSREGGTSWTRDPGGRLISQNTSGTLHYYLTDRLGSVVGLADSTGALVQTYKYDPYGRIRSTTGSVPNPFRYVGAYQSGGTSGLYKMGARYYNPLTTGWTQLDAIESPTDLRSGNRYAYAASDPVNLVDTAGTHPGPSGGDQPLIPCPGDSYYGEYVSCRKSKQHEKFIKAGCAVATGSMMLEFGVKKIFKKQIKGGKVLVTASLVCGAFELVKFWEER